MRTGLAPDPGCVRPGVQILVTACHVIGVLGDDLARGLRNVLWSRESLRVQLHGVHRAVEIVGNALQRRDESTLCREGHSQFAKRICVSVFFTKTIIDLFYFILLTHMSSHIRKSTENSNQVRTFSASVAKDCLEHRFHAPQPTLSNWIINDKAPDGCKPKIYIIMIDRIVCVRHFVTRHSHCYAPPNGRQFLPTGYHWRAHKILSGGSSC